MESFQLTNACIYTMDPRQPLVSSLVCRSGKVERVLAEDPLDSENSLDLGGRIVLPGLIDAHLHLRQYAESLQYIDCETRTKEECLEKVAERAALTQPGEWIRGHGWNHNYWSDGYGTAAELDQISPHNPVYLTGKSLHVSWANSAALKIAGIGAQTLDPPRGTLLRNENGSPTGILFEEAVKLIEKVIPSPSVEAAAEGIRKAQEELWKMGISGVHDFDRELCYHALQYLADREQLKLRVQKSIPAKYLPTAIELGLRTGFGTDWLWIGGVKDFADGALGPQTAAMLEPYQGSSTNRGMPLLTEDKLLELGIRAALGGFSLAIHAIGDQANRTVLNALEKIRDYEREQGINPLPHRIEHLQLLDPEDVPRLAGLNITASMQPIHATSDMEMADKYWGKRTSYSYASQLQLQQGARVVFGSDAPVDSPNPFWSIHAAVTRRKADGFPGPNGWHPELRVPLGKALEAYTIGPAAAGGKSGQQGSLAPGYWADLIVLEKDPFSCSEDELRELRPSATMIGGEWVWREF